ncbi:TIGR01777 family oxidoreductase [Aestuariibacter salexigens]|uniref:TIGR01777 family oxidoreductase n=1 Tax=Aestuariibacter salexigens TaxID=226010 RepID=UPI0004133B8B|nr:TIGR01777 family oxidoreductase [Aestuariibacter salexigens]
MRILVTGGTGLIGKHLIAKLCNEHCVTVLTRRVAEAEPLFAKSVTLISSLDDFNNLDDFDAIINLAGEPIVDKRWTDKQKQIICHSRWDITEKISNLIAASEKPPEVFISGSAIGVYGRQGEQEIDETFTDMHDEFSHQVCARWESIAMRAQIDQTRVCLLRTGVVLASKGGALAKMLLPFKLGVGGHVGSGKQYMSWIHIDDMVNGIVFLLDHSDCHGAFNLTAPKPVTSRQFSKALAKRLHRPCLFPVPGFVLKIALGEASDLLLYGQNVVPNKLIEHGFTFSFPEIDGAFEQLNL